MKWKSTDFQLRSRLMKRSANMLREEKEALAQLMTLEMGKIIAEARAEIEKCAWVCEFYAEHAEAFLADELVETNASKGFVSFEPISGLFWQLCPGISPSGRYSVLQPLPSRQAMPLYSNMPPMFQDAPWLLRIFLSKLDFLSIYSEP